MPGMQLDLFLDSRAVILANDVAAALLARDVERARAAVSVLRDEAPDYPSLDALARLTAVLDAWSPRVADAAAAEEQVDLLERQVAPVAERALGEAAPAFVASFFRDLAAAALGRGYDPTRPRSHRAWLCLRCGDWAEAEAAADSIPAASANPDALHWRSVARYRQRGLAAASADLFVLAWAAPQRLPRVVVDCGDELLLCDWQRFERASDWTSVPESELPAWFPAWCLLAHPAAAQSALHELALPHVPAAQAAGVLRDLLALEREGDTRKLAQQRARLRELNSDLFALYMASRTTRYL
jgi:hypothetical protein